MDQLTRLILSGKYTEETGIKVSRRAALVSGLQLVLARDTRFLVRSTLAKNPALGQAAQLVLATDHSSVRVSLARNPSLALDTQLALAASSSRCVLEALSQNPMLHPAVLVALALSPLIPESAQYRLAGCTDPRVQAALVQNPAVTPQALAILAKSTVLPEDVQFALLWSAVVVRVELARNPCTVPEVQFALGVDRSPMVRRVLAGNPGLAEAVQFLLAHDENPLVLGALVANPLLTVTAKALLGENHNVKQAKTKDADALTVLDSNVFNLGPKAKALLAKRMALMDSIRA